MTVAACPAGGLRGEPAGWRVQEVHPAGQVPPALRLPRLGAPAGSPSTSPGAAQAGAEELPPARGTAPLPAGAGYHVSCDPLELPWGVHWPVGCSALTSLKFLPRMMSTESANSFTLIGEASDGGTMENLSRRLKASVP